MRLPASLISVLLLSSTLAFLPSIGWAATAAQIATARTNALVYLYKTQNSDGSWGGVPGIKVVTTTTVVESLLSAGVSTGATYNAALSELTNIQPNSTDGLARQLSTLYRTGYDTSAQIADLTSAANGSGGWGSLPGHGSNVADTALAVIALMDASITYSTDSLVKAACNVLIPGQTASGGWGYLPKPSASGAPAGLATPAILPTAYSMLALQKASSRFSSVTCAGTGYTLSNLMSNGVSWLLSKRNADNGFGEAGVSGALETALAYRAISAATPSHSALAPALDYIIGSQQATGAWAGDALQTAMALQALGGAGMTDSKGIGVPDAVASIIWPTGQINVRSLVAGNGQSVGGQTVSNLVGVTNLNQGFAGQLSPPAGGGVFTYRLVSGALPDGISLAANGSLSGRATASGIFNFSYQATDSQNRSFTLAGQIEVDGAVDTPDPSVLDAILPAIFLLLLD